MPWRIPKRCPSARWAARVRRDRGAQLAATGSSAAPLEERLRDLRERMDRLLDALPPGELDREREYPGLPALTGREVLLIAALHAAEHAGQAELTRDLLRTCRAAP